MAIDRGMKGAAKDKVYPTKTKVILNAKAHRSATAPGPRSEPPKLPVKTKGEALVDKAEQFILRYLPRQKSKNQSTTTTSPSVRKWDKQGLSQNVEDRRPMPQAHKDTRHERNWTDDDAFWTYAEEQWGLAAPANVSASLRAAAFRLAAKRLNISIPDSRKPRPKMKQRTGSRPSGETY